MWVNPKYAGQVAEAEPPQQRQPPAETGRRLATFPRDKRGSGDEEELRIEVAEYQGHKFVSLRLWFRSPQDGRFYPTRKGVSLRRVELADAIEALKAAERIIGDAPPPARRERRPQQQRQAQAPRVGVAREFDEFG